LNINLNTWYALAIDKEENYEKTNCGNFDLSGIDFSIFSLQAVADPGAELEIKIMGGLHLPLFLHLVGGVIGNDGDTTVYNVSYKLTINGGIFGGVHETFEGFTDAILPNTAYSVLLNDVYGFGLVVITLNASATNAENATGMGKGFQLGEFTWVPLSWITP
jgi:hypothetical protein